MDMIPGHELEPYIVGPDAQTVELARWFEACAAPDRWLLRFGVDELDDAITVAPPDVVAIAGRPSMGKSQLCKWLARLECDRIVEAGESDSRCVVFVTLEESARKVTLGVNGLPLNMRAVKRGEFDAEDAKRWIYEPLARPLFVVRHPGLVGHGQQRRMAGAITSQLVIDAVTRITETTTGKRRPTLVVLDYLQLLRPDSGRADERTRVAEIIAATEGAKLIAAALECVVVLAVQAGREADGRTPPLPTMADMQWGSVIEQACDLILGILRPCRHPAYAPDARTGDVAPVMFRGRSFPVTEDMLLVSIVKQRDDIGHGTFLTALDVRTNTLSEYPGARVPVGIGGAR